MAVQEEGTVHGGHCRWSLWGTLQGESMRDIVEGVQEGHCRRSPRGTVHES